MDQPHIFVVVPNHIVFLVGSDLIHYLDEVIGGFCFFNSVF